MNALYHDTPDDSQPPLTEKKCSKCKEIRPIKEFSKHSCRKDGHRSYCKNCAKSYNVVRNELDRPVSVTSKMCSKCGIEKVAHEFGTDPRSTTGLRSECNECRKPESHDYYANRYGLKRKQLPEPVNGGKVCRRCEIEKPFEQFTPDKRASDKRTTQCRQCVKEVQEANHTPEERSEKYQRWREENYEHSLEYSRQWKRDHPLEVRQMNARREAIKKAVQVGDSVDYIRIMERDGWFCYLCGGLIDPSAPPKTPGSLVFDHVVPLIPRPGEPQGTHAGDNIKPAHHLCNARKRNVPFELLTPYQRRGLD